MPELTLYQQHYLQDISNQLGELEAGLVCEDACEGYFSWSSCDVCGDKFGGQRHPVAFFSGEGNKVSDGECCDDCLCYLANGDLPEGPDNYGMEDIDE